MVFVAEIVQNILSDYYAELTAADLLSRIQPFTLHNGDVHRGIEYIYLQKERTPEWIVNNFGIFFLLNLPIAHKHFDILLFDVPPIGPINNGRKWNHSRAE